MKKCVIIMNPESGKKKKITTYHEFYDILRKYGYETEILLTKKRGDAEKLIQGIDDSIDLVLSAGGDGTLNEVVTGNTKRTKPLTIAPLPMGSTNDVGNMYGLDKSVYENLESILKGKEKKVDVCYINNKPFIYVACLGDYIDLAYSTPRRLKKRYGKVAYILYGVRQIFNKISNYKIRYKVDGKKYHGTYSFIFITNASRVAGQPDIYYDVKLDDNMFEVALAKVKNKTDMIKMLVLLSTMDLKDIPGITYYQTDNFELEFIDKPKKSWCLDGEELKSTTKKYVFRVEQNMKMRVPKENISKLFQNN